MKKVLSVVMLAMLTMGVFGGCGKVETPAAGDAEVKEETPVEEEPEDEEPVVEEELTDEELARLEEEWIVAEYGPQPSEEEIIVLEAELKAEVEQNKEAISELAQKYIDIILNPDPEYTQDERIADLIENEIIQKGSEFNFYEHTTWHEPDAFYTIYDYKIKDVVYLEEIMKYDGELNPYSERRERVGIDIRVDVNCSTVHESEPTINEFSFLMVGSMYDGEFVMNTQWSNY